MHTELGRWDAGGPGDQRRMAVTGVRWRQTRKESLAGVGRERVGVSVVLRWGRAGIGRRELGGGVVDIQPAERKGPWKEDATDLLLAKITDHFLLRVTSGHIQAQ